MGSDDTTPVWTMRPELPKVGSAPKIPVEGAVPLVADNGNNQRMLEDILSAVRDSLEECRLIRRSGQETASHALKVFEEIPSLKKRMNRVEMVAIGATIINAVMLFIALCH